MEFKINTKVGALLSLLSVVSGVIPRSSTTPIITHALFESISDSTIRVTGSDMEVEAISMDTVGEVLGSFRIAIESRKLLDILRALPADSNLSMQSDGDTGRVILKGKGFRFVLQSMDAADFPKIKITGEGKGFNLPAQTLAQALSRVSHTQAIQDVRYYLCGTLIDINDKTMEVVSTDGHRLTRVAITSENSLPNASLIIPRKGAAEIQRLVEAHDGDCRITAFGNHIRVECGDNVILSKLIDGRFPDYKRVIPINGFNGVLKIDKSELRTAVQASSTLLDAKSAKTKGVQLNFKTGMDGTILTLKLNNDNQEESDLSLPVEYTGQDMAVNLNINYLREAVLPFIGDKVQMQMTGSNGSVLFSDPSDSSIVGVVMPMRV